jgi:hypothetical protein
MEVSQRLRDMKDDRGFGGNVWGQGFCFSERVGRAKLTELYAAQVRGSLAAGSKGGTHVAAVMSLHPVESTAIVGVIVLSVVTMVSNWRAALFSGAVMLSAHVTGCLLRFTPSVKRSEDLLRSAAQGG